MHEIIDRPIHYNHDGTPLKPIGIVVHSTATPNATDEAEIKYFDACNKDASAHYFVDYDSISRAVKETEVAWHAARTANSKFLGIELCEFADSSKFEEIWKRGVWLVSDICKRWGFGVDKVYSHRDISNMWHECDHTDPHGYFSAHNKTFDDFKNDVQTLLEDDFPMDYKQKVDDLIASWNGLMNEKNQMHEEINSMKIQLDEYQDQTVSLWAKEFMDAAVAKGLIKGDELGHLNPKAPLNLERFITILGRVKLL